MVLYFFPASYFFGDVIAEVYGYQFARQLIWSAIFCQFIASLFILFVLHTPYPHYWHFENDFNVVLGHSFRYAIASTVGNFFGEFANVYIITKVKILLKGRYFWLRSIESTSIGEGMLTFVVFFITFIGLTGAPHVFDLMISAYIFKVSYSFIAVIPATYLVRFLKRSEGIDTYDYGTDFNPFKFSIDKNTYNKATEAS